MGREDHSPCFLAGTLPPSIYPSLQTVFLSRVQFLYHWFVAFLQLWCEHELEEAGQEGADRLDRQGLWLHRHPDLHGRPLRLLHRHPDLYADPVEPGLSFKQLCQSLN